ncbi:MAG: ABC transporter permease subunit [Armatimonadota bacterium]|nr:ABC transporter permease subunit [Armatimonadota bacterium]MDR5702489.1 ABC transporter permease subunit [Armatimonadota bacterium]
MRGAAVTAIWKIASREFELTARSRWSWAFALLLAILALGVSYLGLSLGGYARFVGFARTATSLVNLITFLIPVNALALGVLAFSPEQGDTEVLLAQPITRREVVVGKYLGACGAMSAGLLWALGISGVVIALRAGLSELVAYAVLVVLSILLCMVFLGLGALVSIVARNRMKALGGALALWILLGVLYDLMVLGVSILFGGEWLRPILLSSVLANPMDTVRVVVLMLVGAKTSLGPGGAILGELAGSVLGKTLIAVSLVAWVMIPLWLATRAFQEQDI